MQMPRLFYGYGAKEPGEGFAMRSPFLCISVISVRQFLSPAEMKEMKEILLRHAKPFLRFPRFLRDDSFKGTQKAQTCTEILWISFISVRLISP